MGCLFFIRMIVINKDIPAVLLNDVSVNLELSFNTIATFYQQRDQLYIGKPHRLRFSALVYITQGDGYHFIDYKRYQLKPGTLLTLGKHQVHHFSEHCSVEGYVISFSNEFLHSGGDDPYQEVMATAVEEVNCITETADNLGGLFDQIDQEYHREGSSYKDEIIRNLMRALMLKEIVPNYQALCNNTSLCQKNINYHVLKKHIETVFSQRPSVGDLAKTMGKSIKQLDKIAKDYSGRSVKELIDDRVLLEAKRLLAFSQYSILDISLLLGFKEATNMTKFFRRHTSLTPKDFRDLCRTNVAKRVG